MKKIFLILSFIVFQCTQIFAQYNGGNGDGHDSETNLNTTLTNISLAVLYEGSNGDGYGSKILLSTTLENIVLTALYEGSNGDGFDNAILVSTTLENVSLSVLYEGSNGDGFDQETLLNTTLENISLTVLYEGSNGDGFDKETLLNTTLENISLTALYEGSNGDGFDKETLLNTTLNNLSLVVLYNGGNGDGFNVAQELVYLDPNQIVDLRLNIKLFLQGPLINPPNASLMNDDLRVNGFIPLMSPYPDMRLINNSSVLNNGGALGTGLSNDDIVDWVWIEIRSDMDNTFIVDDKSALLQRDGDVVDIDGLSNIYLEGYTDPYYIVVRHRNHLSVMTQNPIALSVSPTFIDFTNSATATFGNNAQISLLSGANALWAGNVNGDSLIQYSGTTPDAPSILSEVLNDPGNVLNFPTFLATGYNVHDVDMNGNIQYTGTTPDTPFILQNVLAHPENVFNFSTHQIKEQLPEN
ncbi:hypothetical protein FG167_09470 [Lacinutrix sp. WUR7]|uniref:hypothetical protein n=1 Tax=Lacinutrix sp. WUR7 TaxID=2653681 RepID=UPI00193D94E2|nr:hypothetical protein [Lacinutrix sp. WUR7]QRM89449.1 hypothetical protein FG167_09470 [Lacinutrix sp. WUR7]